MNAANILVPHDFSDMSQAALKEADDLAVRLGSALTLLHVHPVTAVTVLDYTYAEPPELVAQAVEAVESRLRKVAAELQTPPERISIKVKTGEPASTLTEASRTHDLVVMGTHGRTGVGRFLMGSVAERVVRGAACSVLIVRPRETSET